MGLRPRARVELRYKTVHDAATKITKNDTMYSTFLTSRSHLIDTIKLFDVTMIRSVFFVHGEGPYISFTFIDTEMRSC